MKDPAQPSGVRFQDCQGVIPCVALMNDNIQPKGNGEVQMNPKSVRLGRLIGPIQNCRFSILRDPGLQGGDRR